MNIDDLNSVFYSAKAEVEEFLDEFFEEFLRPEVERMEAIAGVVFPKVEEEIGKMFRGETWQ